MKRRKYRSLPAKSIDWARFAEAVRDQKLVFGIDVAKKTQYGCLTTARNEAVLLIRWDLVTETTQVLTQLSRLPVSSLDLVLEPSGTYGDPIRQEAARQGLPVFRVSSKRTHDLSEYFDGVPSSHDGKSAAVIACLHWDGASEPWPLAPESTRDLAARLTELHYTVEALQRARNRLEGRLARHWPEVLELLELGGASLPLLLAQYGSPQAVAANASEAKAFLRKVGGANLRQSKIDAVVASAGRTLGILPSPLEAELLQRLAQEIVRLRAQRRVQERQVRGLTAEDEVIQRLAPVVGDVTAAVVFVRGGDPRSYPSASAYLKSLGLNLKERSSGRRQGQLAITKRGPSIVRHWLYLATLRWIQDDAVASAWYHRKIARDGGKKLRALVALMRKLARALWALATSGESFDSCKLFDVRRLKLAA
jgi:transposase